MAQTEFSTRCEILGDLWMNYRGDEEFKDFIEYNDLGLPLAYAVSRNMVKANSVTEDMVNETFDILVAGLGLVEDTGFENLDDLLGGTLE